MVMGSWLGVSGLIMAPLADSGAQRVWPWGQWVLGGGCGLPVMWCRRETALISGGFEGQK